MKNKTDKKFTPMSKPVIHKRVKVNKVVPVRKSKPIQEEGPETERPLNLETD